jgi:dienelactone hydrolase
MAMMSGFIDVRLWVLSLMARRVLFWLTALLLMIGLGAYASTDYLSAGSFVIRAAGMQGFVRTVADSGLQPVQDSRLTIPWRGGTLTARIYKPARASSRPILLVPGVHAAGVDEPRLDAFARNFAGMGHPVLSVGLPDLARYSITPRTTDMIEDAARWWTVRQAADGHPVPIGIVGISFGGGLSVVAASRLNDVAWVLSFGGHGDLPRTLRYLCTGIQPDQSTRPPHDYGVAIILLGVADRVVPEEQVEPLRTAILEFLHASHLDMYDKGKAAEAFEHARSLANQLGEPARTLMGYVNGRDVAHLGPVLLPHVSALGGDPALSPERSPPPRAPVHLLHGSDDNVIPAIESRLLAAHLEHLGVETHVLLTPLITHAEVDRPPTVAEIWNLIRFWEGVFSE